MIERAESEQAATLTLLESMDLGALQAEWRTRFSGSPPAGRAVDLMRHELAWRLQAQVQGGLDPASGRLLRGHVRAAASKPTSGRAATRNAEVGANLIREWRGTTHRVKVLARGYLYEGREYRSLTTIAQAITGAHWSGPRFFGLTDRPSE